MPTETPADHRYATIRYRLARQETPIGPNDLLIATHALTNDHLTVVMFNVGEFSSVPQLKVENCLRA